MKWTFSEEPGAIVARPEQGGEVRAHLVEPDASAIETAVRWIAVTILQRDPDAVLVAESGA